MLFPKFFGLVPENLSVQQTRGLSDTTLPATDSGHRLGLNQALHRPGGTPNGTTFPSDRGLVCVFHTVVG